MTSTEVTISCFVEELLMWFDELEERQGDQAWRYKDMPDILVGGIFQG